jgi:hypothetical protein
MLSAEAESFDRPERYQCNVDHGESPKSRLENNLAMNLGGPKFRFKPRHQLPSVALVEAFHCISMKMPG